MLTYSELGDIWHACEDTDYGRIIRLLILTGQRRNEVANLLWPEIDFDKGEMKLPGARTKNGYPHVVALSEQAMEVLQSILPIHGRDFFLARVLLVFRAGRRLRQRSTTGSTNGAQRAARSQ